MKHLFVALAAFALLLSAGRWDAFADDFPPADRQWRTDRFVLSIYEPRKEPSR